ncbi:hypothetical protein GCM10023144_34500 [Pigmentiphaga soli]|uniref:Gcp-like domain-containing protein n=1 Tax=Pigmentiphaga soli TaxID=1007095 RepID=A0ABP8HDW0_9BURK
MPLPILALETSSAWCGVALLRDAADGRPVIHLREHEGVQEHSERLLPMIGEVLAEAGLSRAAIGAVAFGQGPGGFTGLRVACGVAQGLGFALGVPVLPVVSHAAVAAQLALAPGQVALVAMDARMREVYLAAYRERGDGSFETLLAPLLAPLDGLDEWLAPRLAQWAPGGAFRLCGDAALVHPDHFAALGGQPADAPLRPTAAAVARLARQAWRRGEAVAPEQATPLYVRDKVAFTTAERLAGAGGNPRVAAIAQEGGA